MSWLALRWSLDKSQIERQAGQPRGPGPDSDTSTGEDKPLLHSCYFNLVCSGWKFYLAAFVSKLAKMPTARRRLSRWFFRKRLWQKPQPRSWMHGKHTYWVIWLQRDLCFHLWAILQLHKLHTNKFCLVYNTSSLCGSTSISCLFTYVYIIGFSSESVATALGFLVNKQFLKYTSDTCSVFICKNLIFSLINVKAFREYLWKCSVDSLDRTGWVEGTREVCTPGLCARKMHSGPHMPGKPEHRLYIVGRPAHRACVLGIFFQFQRWTQGSRTSDLLVPSYSGLPILYHLFCGFCC